MNLSYFLTVYSIFMIIAYYGSAPDTTKLTTVIIHRYY